MSTEQSTSELNELKAEKSRHSIDVVWEGEFFFVLYCGEVIIFTCWEIIAFSQIGGNFESAKSKLITTYSIIFSRIFGAFARETVLA